MFLVFEILLIRLMYLISNILTSIKIYFKILRFLERFFFIFSDIIRRINKYIEY